MAVALSDTFGAASATDLLEAGAPPRRNTFGTAFVLESKDPSKLLGSAETKTRSQAAATRASYSSSANKWSESVFSSEVSLPATLFLCFSRSLVRSFSCLPSARDLSPSSAIARCVCVCVCVCTYTYTCTYSYAYTYIYILVYLLPFAWVVWDIFPCVCLCFSTHTHTHTHTHTWEVRLDGARHAKPLLESVLRLCLLPHPHSLLPTLSFLHLTPILSVYYTLY
jgi:hypothetical protein